MKTLLHGLTGMAVAVLTVASLTAAEGNAGKETATAGDALFSQLQVYRLKIDLPPAAQDALRKDPKTYVRASVREGGQTLADVGVRLKGSGSFQGLEKKPSFAIKFNEFISGQKFKG